MKPDNHWYDTLAAASLAGERLSAETVLHILTDPAVELLPLLNAAFSVRRHYHGREVTIHILNNVKNGRCPEDCSYCAQSRNSTAEIEAYETKSDEEVLAEAGRAYEAGAHRYCMVYAGRGLGLERLRHIGSLVRRIKTMYPLEVCVSPGLIDETGARILQEAGLDRLNHNLNTAPSRYARICTTHTFEDRLHTLRTARKAGLEVCSGIIAGMGEEPAELGELAILLREVEARSIPVNFLLPIKGNPLDTPRNLTPDYCLRILCLFRFLNPAAEIRIAAGREQHLRSMEVMGLYPANSLFMDGYLNTRGDNRFRTLAMIRDAGFFIRSDRNLDALLTAAEPTPAPREENRRFAGLKSAAELRPSLNNR